MTLNNFVQEYIVKGKIICHCSTYKLKPLQNNYWSTMLMCALDFGLRKAGDV